MYALTIFAFVITLLTSFYYVRLLSTMFSEQFQVKQEYNSFMAEGVLAPLFCGTLFFVLCFPFLFSSYINGISGLTGGFTSLIQ